MRAIKELGQNFLINPHTAKRIRDLTIQSPQNDRLQWILEVGPGKGSLTFPLAGSHIKIVAIEKDRFLAERLSKELEAREIDNVSIIAEDILSYDLSSSSSKPYAVVGSLPFNISKRIIRKFLTEEDHRPSHVHVVIQKEVARNYTSFPPKGTYLSNFAQIYSAPEYQFTIPRRQFSPIPAVDSAVVSFELKDVRPESRDLDSFVRRAFATPRKTLKNNLRSALRPEAFDKLCAENKASTHNRIDLSKRPSEITPDEFEHLHFVYNKPYLHGPKQKDRQTTA